MKEFGDLAAFAAFTTGLIAHVDHARHEALEKGAVIIETEAKRVIGTYDYGWTPLAASTIEKKAADTPLLETGEMRDSIEHKVVSTSEAHVGSNSDKAAWQELGTATIPPRSFLMQSAIHKQDEVGKAIGQHLVPKLIQS